MAVRTLVVPLDGSEFAERALPVASALAQRAGGDVVLVSSRIDGPEEPQRYLEKIAAGLEVNAAITVVHDRPAVDAIRLVASEGSNRVVCMTSHGRGGVRWMMLGSVAEHVVRNAPGSVLLVGRHCAMEWAARPAHVLACLDGTERSEQVVPEAVEWARALGTELRVAVVIHPLDVESAEHYPDLLGPMAQRLAARDIHVEPALLRASFVAGALVDYANELGAAMIALTSHSRTGLARVALGSVAMGVVGLARCPVLVAHAR